MKTNEPNEPPKPGDAASAPLVNAEPPVSPAIVKSAPNSQAKPKKPVAQSRPAPKPAPKPAQAAPVPVLEEEAEQTEPEPAKSESPFSIFGWD